MSKLELPPPPDRHDDFGGDEGGVRQREPHPRAVRNPRHLLLHVREVQGQVSLLPTGRHRHFHAQGGTGKADARHLHTV